MKKSPELAHLFSGGTQIRQPKKHEMKNKMSEFSGPPSLKRPIRVPDIQKVLDS